MGRDWDFRCLRNDARDLVSEKMGGGKGRGPKVGKEEMERRPNGNERY